VSRMQPAGDSCSVPLVEVGITGVLDAARLPITRTVLDAAVRLRPARLVVDLAECSGIDAAAIGMLLDVHRELSRTGSQLTLRAPNPRLRRILGIARVDHVLHTVAGPAHGQVNEHPAGVRRDAALAPPDGRAGGPARRIPATPESGPPSPHASGT
jgi:anti-anti-sigma factor